MGGVATRKEPYSFWKGNESWALPVDVPADLVEKAKVLDGFYIPTRCANSHAEGPPFEHFGVIHSDEALSYARKIIEFARPFVAAA